MKNEELNINVDKLNSIFCKFKSKNILICGTGGSYITGLYAQKIIEDNTDNLCRVLKPMEVLQSRLDRFNLAIIFSYKMLNYDINRALQYIIKEKSIDKVIIFTSNRSFIKDNNKIDIIYYDNYNINEKTYVSFKGIYIPTYLLGKCFEKINIDKEKIIKTKLECFNDKILHVFYDRENFQLTQLIERHFCELGIATVIIHEKKDFSHGRMHIFSNQDNSIILKSSSYDKNYEDLLCKYLKNKYKSKILNEKEKDDLNYLERLILYMNWIYETSKERGINPEKIKDTNEDKILFKYKGGIDEG